MIRPSHFQSVEREPNVKVDADQRKPLVRIGGLTVDSDLLTEVGTILYCFGRKQTKCGPFATALKVLNDRNRISPNASGFSCCWNRYRTRT